MTRIACVELAPAVGEVAANQELVLASLATDADIVVLPELATSGYAFASADEARACALAVDDPRVAQWSRAVSAETVAVIGFAELGTGGEVFDSAAVIDRTGVLAVHRKVHLWDREQLFFQAADRPPAIVDTRHGRLAVMVCYDMEFPEYTRMAGLAGADLLAVPTNWPLFPRPDGERPAEVIIAQAAARLNRMAVACCDRAGTERGQEWTRGTAIIDQDGWVVAGVGGDRTAEVELTRGRSKWISERNDLFADRRLDVYGC